MVDAQLNINLFDALVYGTLFIAAAISLYRGFIREFLSLLTWFGAGVITLAMADKTTGFMMNHIESQFGATMVSVMLTYFIALMVLGMFAKLLMRYVRDGADVGWVDNVLGLFFGFIKGGLVVVLGFILMTLVFQGDEELPQWVREASTLPAVQSATIKVVRIMPEYLGGMASFRNELAGNGDASESGIEGETQADRMQAIEQGIDREFVTIPEVNEEQLRQGSGVLEQLIRDVTKDRPQEESSGGYPYQQRSYEPRPY